jgi:hypothetical protein
MLWRKKSIIRGQGRVLDVDDEGKSEVAFACFCSLLTTLHAALEGLLANIPMVCPLLEKPIAWTIKLKNANGSRTTRFPPASTAFEMTKVMSKATCGLFHTRRIQ